MKHFRTVLLLLIALVLSYIAYFYFIGLAPFSSLSITTNYIVFSLIVVSQLLIIFLNFGESFFFKIGLQILIFLLLMSSSCSAGKMGMYS